MKAPYDITPSDLTYCPHCDSVNDDIIETSNGERGCTLCIDNCAICDNRYYIDSMQIAWVRKDGKWMKELVCEYCLRLHDEDPDIYNEVVPI
jgi:hypothetical protein